MYTNLILIYPYLILIIIAPWNMRADLYAEWRRQSHLIIGKYCGFSMWLTENRRHASGETY